MIVIKTRSSDNDLRVKVLYCVDPEFGYLTSVSVLISQSRKSLFSSRTEKKNNDHQDIITSI